jgi:NADH-quinone oxidoreductase subunit E/NADH-quinone oxidoreductase subunit F
MEDIDLVAQLCRTIPGLTICPTGEAFSLPILAMVSKFRPEFEALLHERISHGPNRRP